jgi:hypothetical protein
MEFRRYDKINCTLFDLIDGDLEVKQTMALGYLFSKSKLAISLFLKLLNVQNLKYDKYIVDCEAQGKQASQNGRIDILIRFYNNYQPIYAIIIEAKSVRASTKSYVAANQVVNYLGFHQLANFKPNEIVLVTITRDASIKHASNGVISISWSHLISELHDAVIKKKNQDQLIDEFLSFIINIKGNMNYYQEEILSIPAGETINAVMASGIYERPTHYSTQKKSLFLAFRASGKGKNGIMEKLYKLEDKFELDLNDQSAITVIDRSFPGFAQSINSYKINASYPTNDHQIKQVYLLDKNRPIILSIPVRPVENNTSPIYYSLSDFLRVGPNSNIGNIIVQKNIWIDGGNILHVVTKGKKNYELNCGNQVLKTFSSNGTQLLNTTQKYTIKVIGKNRKVQLKQICLTYNNNQWEFEYIF